MKRHPSLQPLSREHHRALLCWRKLDQAVESPADYDLDSVLRELCHYWSSRFDAHLRQEELILLPLLSPPLQERFLSEHNALRSMYAALFTKGSPNELSERNALARRFAATLRGHIRWEERIVFPFLQDEATDAELQSILEATARSDSANDSDRCDLS